MTEQLLSPRGQQCLQTLMRVWFEFERQLGRVPLLQRLERGQFSKADYCQLLLNWRQQVIEGSRWISRCASSFDRDYSDVRSVIIGHAREECREQHSHEKQAHCRLPPLVLPRPRGHGCLLHFGGLEGHAG